MNVQRRCDFASLRLTKDLGPDTFRHGLVLFEFFLVLAQFELVGSAAEWAAWTPFHSRQCCEKLSNCKTISTPCSLVVGSFLVDVLVALVAQSVFDRHPGREANQHLQAMGLGHIRWAWKEELECRGNSLLFQDLVRLRMRLAGQSQSSAVGVEGKQFPDVGPNFRWEF